MSMSEDEQIAQLKEWWQRNGKPLLAGGVLALALVFGWQAWQEWQLKQSQAASALYQQLLETSLMTEGAVDLGRVSELAGKLDSEFGGSHYAQYASLFLAKAAVEAGKFDDAAGALQKVLEKPVDATLAELARQRLARVLAVQDKTEEALALLAGEAASAWQASREELRGDLLVRLGRTDEAHQAYQKAKDVLAENAAVGGLQMKLDDLAKGDA